ncbi:MAG: hypothetical protein QXZ08_03560 [Nitrososphaeria archaeon]
MQLVIDANIVISSLIGNGTIFLLIKELDEHFDEIMVKSGL